MKVVFTDKYSPLQVYLQINNVNDKRKQQQQQQQQQQNRDNNYYILKEILSAVSNS